MNHIISINGKDGNTAILLESTFISPVNMDVYFSVIGIGDYLFSKSVDGWTFYKVNDDSSAVHIAFTPTISNFPPKKGWTVDISEYEYLVTYARGFIILNT